MRKQTELQFKGTLGVYKIDIIESRLDTIYIIHTHIWQDNDWYFLKDYSGFYTQKQLDSIISYLKGDGLSYIKEF